MVVQMKNLSVVLSAKVDRFKADMASAGATAVATAQKTETAWDKSNGRIGKSMKFAQQYEREMTAVGGVMAGFGGIVVGSLGLATKAAFDWESAWTGVTKTIDGSPRQLNEIEKGLRGLSKELPASHKEIAGVAEAAGQLGVATQDVVGFTKTMIDLGETTNLTSEEAATDIAQIANIMGTSGKDISRFGATLVELGNNGASTEKDILNMSQRIAGAGKLVGASESDVLALSNALASVGVRAELGGGVMSRVMNRMYNDVQTGGKGLEELAKVSGVSAEEFASAFQNDPVRAVSMMTEGLNRVKASGGNVVETMKNLGIKGTEETQVILALAGAGDLLTESLDMGNAAWEQNAALAEEAAKRYNTAESRMTMAGNKIVDAGIKIGAAFAPAVAGAVEAVGWLVDTVAQAPEPVLQMGGAIGGIAGAASLAVGGFLVLAPRISETIEAVNTLRSKSQSLDKVMSFAGMGGRTRAVFGGIIKGLGAVAGAWAAVEIAAASYNAMSTKPAVRGIEDVTAALIASSKAGDMAYESLDKMFQGKGGKELTGDVDSLAEGIDDVMYKGDSFNKFMNEKFLWGVGDKINAHLGLDKTKQQFNEMDEALANMVNSGNTEIASEQFAKVARSFEDQGYKAQDAVKFFPELEKAYQSVANQVGETVSETEMLNWMMTGEVPAAVQAAAAGSAKGQEALDSLGNEAADAEAQIESLADEIRGFGSEFLDVREASRQVEAGWDDLNEAIKSGKTSLDDSTEAGRRNNEMLDSQARNINDATASNIENGDSAEVVARKHKKMRDELIRVATQFFGSKKKAKEYVDQVLRTPKEIETDVKINTEGAVAKLKTTKEWMDKIKNKSVWVHVNETYIRKERGVKTYSRDPKNKSVQKAQYYGGIDVKPMAAGGMLSNNIAEMVKPNTWRLVGDRMDVDEAFIPIDGSKRSWKILMETISRMPGTQPFARGAIASAQSGVDSAEAKLRSARRDKQDAKSKKAKAQADRRVRIAEDELTSAKKGLKAAKERQKADEKAAKLAADRAREERERQARVSEMRSDVRTDIRRGNTRESVTGSLSGAYGAVDQLFGYGSNKDLSRGARQLANKSARRFEGDLRGLYAQAERIDNKLKKAQDKATELKGIKDSVVSSLLGGRDLDVGMYSTKVNGQWTTQSNLGQAAKSLKGDVGAMKAFAGKLKKLNDLGVPGAIIQEIAQAGVEEGSTMADSFIGASAGERKSYIGAWKDYEKYAGQAGQYVTEGFYKGGVNAANGVVKGLESQQKSVEKAIADMAKSIEKTFKKVLGIHSPSTVMEEAAFWVPEAARLSIVNSIPSIQEAAAQLGSAMVPGSIPTAMAFDVTATPVVAEDEGTAGLAMQGMSSVTLDSMSQMQVAVSEGFANMVANTQAAQGQMLLDTQLSNLGMTTNTQEQNAAMLLDIQTQQEAMRATVAHKQIAQKNVSTEQQELMRLMLIDKQSQMKKKSEEDFDSLKKTTGRKFGDMRTNTDTTMSNLQGDYDTRLGDLRKLNKEGFESVKKTSNSNMEGVRKGINAEMDDAKPQLGSRMNNLISVLGSFSSSVNKAFGDVGVKLPAPKKLKYADGGMLPGYSPGYDDYRFMDPAGRSLELSGGESIMRPEFGALVGPHWVDGANAAARSGGIEGVRRFLDMPHEAFAAGGTLSFADGGTIPKNTAGLVKLGKALSSIGVRVSEGPAPFGPVHRVHAPGSWHYRQGALDLNTAPGQSAKEMADFDRIMPLLYKLGWGVIWRYAGHYNHAHVDLGNRSLGSFNRNAEGSGDLWQKLMGLRVGAGPAGGFDFHPFLDKAGVSASGDMSEAYGKAARKQLAKIRSKIGKDMPDGMTGDLGEGLIDLMSKNLIKKAEKYGKTAGAGGADFSNVANGPIKQMAKQMLEAMGWGDQFGDLNWLLTRESGWNPNAQNPTSTAYGLFQFLNSTWSSVGGSKTSDPRLQLEYGLKYIKQRYGDVRGARDFWSRHHWYKGGAHAAQEGIAIVGENGPEAIDLRGAERIRNAQQTRKLLTDHRTFISTQQQGLSAAALGEAIATTIRTQGINAQDFAEALNGIQLTFQADGYQFTGAVTSAIANGYQESRSRLAKSSQKMGAIR